MKVEYIVNRVFTSRSYILSSEDGSKVWLIDVGDTDMILGKIGTESSICGLLLTHAHYDHIYGLPSLVGTYPDCPIYTNAAGKVALSDPKKNLSRYHDDSISFVSDRIVIVGEGSRIPLFDDIVAEVLETPGHNPSCLSFKIGTYLFTGDAYIPGENVVTLLPGADKLLANKSLERIISISRGMVVLPGHE